MMPHAKPVKLTKTIITLLVMLLVAATTQPVFAQSCSCGGPPLLGSLESSGIGANRLGFSMRYEYASISDLVDGSDELADNIRTRSVKTGLFGIDYGLTSKITLSALISMIEQQRRTSSGTGSGGQLITRGLGDAILIAQYAFWPVSVHRPQSLSVGFGLKLPLGAADLLDNSLLISADMQPGTGSYDFVFFGSWSYSLSRQFPMALFGTTSYRINSGHDRFGPTNPDYKFGDEFIFTAGISHDLSLRFTPSIALKYRSSQADQFDSVELPSSGGRWLNLIPALNATIINQLSARVAAQLPVWRKLEGTQFSTSHTVALTFFYTFDVSRGQIQI